MATTTIRLTDIEQSVLHSLVERTGKSEEELLHEAVESFLMQNGSQERIALLRRAKGMWKDRQDLPNVRQLRSELDRR